MNDSRTFPTKTVLKRAYWKLLFVKQRCNETLDQNKTTLTRISTAKADHIIRVSQC